MRNTAQLGVNRVEVPILHVPKNWPRHDSQNSIVTRIDAGANNLLEFFQSQARGFPCCIWGDICGYDGDGACRKRHATSQVVYGVNYSFRAPEPQLQRGEALD
jgi:hypothetical protein